MTRMQTPWKELFDCCFYEGLYKFVNGEIQFDDTCDFINRRIEELMDTDDFKKMVDEYFDEFVDGKELKVE